MFELVQVQNENLVTTSLSVAKHFKKRHSDMINSIERLLDEMEGISKSSHTPYFEKIMSQNPQNGQYYPLYYMDRDGFTLLAMGFNNTRDVLEWKLKYIQAFNEMEKRLQSRQMLPDARADVAKLILKASGRQIPAIKELYPEYFISPALSDSLECTVNKNTSYTKWLEDYNITAEWIGEFPTNDIYVSYRRYCTENLYPHTLGKKQFYAMLEFDFNLTRRQKADGFRYFLNA